MTLKYVCTCTVFYGENLLPIFMACKIFKPNFCYGGLLIWNWIATPLFILQYWTIEYSSLMMVLFFVCSYTWSVHQPIIYHQSAPLVAWRNGPMDFSIHLWTIQKVTMLSINKYTWQLLCTPKATQLLSLAIKVICLHKFGKSKEKQLNNALGFPKNF